MSGSGQLSPPRAATLHQDNLGGSRWQGKPWSYQEPVAAAVREQPLRVGTSGIPSNSRHRHAASI